jgi:hypothetical protein
VAALPIVGHTIEWAPGRSPGVVGYRWRVEVDGWGVLLVDVSGSEAVRTGMATHELDQELPTALQRYAAARLDSSVAVLDQLGRWDSPVVLFAEHFRG